MIALVLERATKPGTFWPVRDGVRLTKATRQPFYDAARVLLAAGMDPDAELIASHQGSAIVAMRSTIGEAAKWRVEERDRGAMRKRLWFPYGDAHSSRQGSSESGLGGIGSDIPTSEAASAPGELPGRE